jgi:phosphate transport system substrate-binding protein
MAITPSSIHPSPSKSAGRTPRRRIVRSVGLGLVAAAGLAACGSSNSTTTTTSTSATTTSTPASPAAALPALETAVGSSAASLTENGSSLLAPLFGTWATGYAKRWPKVSITTGDAGSGTGISDAIAGVINIGASDAYLPPADFSESGGMENIPLAISAQQINYNLPGLSETHIKLTGTILSDIYAGTITKWNDPAITKLNPGVSLPNLTIVPLHRSDQSGDTFLFSSFLAASDPASWATKSGGPSPAIPFPTVAGGQGELKNSGMLAGCQAIKGCIAYIGISYLQKTEAAGLGYAALENKSGTFELPTPATITAEASSFTNIPSNGVQSLIYGPAPTGYPIINFEYAIVKVVQPSSTISTAVTSVLAWAMDPTGGSAPSYLDPVNFVALPKGALAVSVALLKKVH